MNHPRRQQQERYELAEFVQELYGPLVLYARQLCQFPEDAVQEAFLEWQRRFARVAGQTLMVVDPTHDRCWLYRAVRHRALNSQRSEQRRRKYESAYSDQRTWFSTAGQSAVEVDEAVAALQTLSDEVRETVVARLWGNLTLEEIAQLTDVSIATAGRRYIRGLEQLKAKLEGQECASNTTTRKQS